MSFTLLPCNDIMTLKGAETMALSKNEILNWIESHVTAGENANVLENDCDIIEFMLDNCEFEILSQNQVNSKKNMTHPKRILCRAWKISPVKMILTLCLSVYPSVC